MTTSSVGRPSLHSTVNTVVAGMLISAVVAHFHQVRVAPGAPLRDAENHRNGKLVFRMSRNPGLISCGSTLHRIHSLGVICRLPLLVAVLFFYKL